MARVTPFHAAALDTSVNIPSAQVSRITLFVSSPGDVAHERRIAREIIARLNTEFAGRIVIEPYFWEYEPFDFSKSFQEQIPNTAVFDVVLCLLWSRLGSRLGASQKLPDGSPANSGTEYEITHALAAQKERKGLPELHVWINQTVPSFQPDPPEVHDERIGQWRALKRFIDRWTKDSQDGSFVGSFTAYRTIAEFQDLFDTKLRKVIERRAAVSPGTLTPPPKPAWTQGSPFRGLEPFDFEHASIFFGRTAAISGAIEALRKTQADKDDPRSFLLVLGASGSGKSSLARAGILPVLTEPGVIEGVGLWRRAVMKPSDAKGDVLMGLAIAILSQSALPELTSHEITPQSLAADPAAIPAEIRSGLRVASEREQARQRSEIEALIRQRESENRADDVAALRARLGAMQPPVARLVLLIDQFEELFADGIIPEKRDEFLGVLTALSRRHPTVIAATMRSDFFPQLAKYPSLLALVEGTGSWHLAQPEPVEFGQIIRRPAQAAGLRFDHHPETKQGLDEALRDAASADPQMLPLLEFALEELYKRQSLRRDGVLRWEDFLAFKGIEGVIAAKAEEALASAGAGEDAVGAVLSALVGFRTERGEAAAPIRRRAAPEEVASSPEAQKLVSAMLDARLLVSDTDAAGRQTISVTHEALLTRWPKAVAWFETNQEFLRQRTRVEAACAVWEKEKRHPAYLLAAGKPLDDAVWLRSQSGKTLAKEIASFIESSKRHAEEAARRRKRTRVIALAAAALLIGAALIAGVIAFQQQRQVAERRVQAEAYFQVHQATLHLARAEPRAALDLLAKAFATRPDFTTRSAFLSALMKAPRQLEMSFTGFGAGVQALQFGPDESLAAAGGGRLRVLDTGRADGSGAAFIPANQEAPTILSIARRADGSWLAQREDGTTVVLSTDGTANQSVGTRAPLRLAALSADGLRLAGVDASQPQRIALGHTDDPAKSTPIEPFAEEVAALAFAPEGQLAVATEKGAIFLVSADGAKRPLRAATQAKVRCLAWRGADKSLLAAGDENGSIVIIESSGAAHELASVPGGVQALAWHPRGETLAAACSDGTVRLWSISEPLDAPAPPEVIAAHKGAALSLAWNGNGSRLASGGSDETVCLWRPSANFGPLITWDKAVPLHSLAVSGDGAHVAVGSEQGDIFTWKGESENAASWHTGSRPLCLAWHDARPRLASGNEAGELQLWQVSERDPVGSLQPEQSSGTDQTIWRVRWSPDGNELAFTSHSGAVKIWKPGESGTPRLVGQMPDFALGLAWSPDGTTCAVGSTLGEIWLWKSTGGAEPILKMPRQPGEGHGDSVSSLAFLRRENVLASCGRDGTLRLWDSRSGALLARTLPAGGALDDLALSPDGTRIAAAGTDGYLRIWKGDALEAHLAVPLHSGPISALAWIGTRIFSASEDGMFRILDLDETKWKARARQIVGVALRHPSAAKTP